jgi:hypothetical protein
LVPGLVYRFSSRPVCHKERKRVLTPVGLAPPERPGGKLLWNLGTSPLRLRPPTLAGAGPAHSGGAQRGPERGRAVGEARGRRGRARATPLGPTVQGKWRSSAVALTFGPHLHLRVCLRVTCVIWTTWTTWTTRKGVGKPPGAFGGELSPRSPGEGCATRAGEPAATRLLPATDSLLAGHGSFYCGLSATPSAFV